MITNLIIWVIYCFISGFLIGSTLNVPLIIFALGLNTFVGLYFVRKGYLP